MPCIKQAHSRSPATGHERQPGLRLCWSVSALSARFLLPCHLRALDYCFEGLPCTLGSPPSTQHSAAQLRVKLSAVGTCSAAMEDIDYGTRFEWVSAAHRGAKWDRPVAGRLSQSILNPPENSYRAAETDGGTPALLQPLSFLLPPPAPQPCRAARRPTEQFQLDAPSTCARCATALNDCCMSQLRSRYH